MGSAPDAIHLWEHLHADRPDLLCLMSAYFKKTKDKGELVNEIHDYFGPDQRDQAAAWAATQDANGREVYFAVAQLLEPRRLSDNASSTRVVHADMDGAPLDACPIRPTAVVESSPGHYHAYWRLSRLVRPEIAEQFNRRLALAIGADKAAVDAVRLMRIPGTHNRKRGEWADVTLVYIDDDRTVDPDELDRVLPKLSPTPPKPAAVAFSAALDDDDEQLLVKLLDRSPIFTRLWQGDTSDYPNATPSDIEWGACKDLVRACGGDTDRAESIMRRCPGLARDKWDARRGQTTYLAYTIAKAAAEVSTEDPGSVRISDGQNATAYRSEDPTTWPELAASIPDGPANGVCSEHCKLRHHPRETALRRQIEFINQTIQLDVSPIVKLTLLWLMVLVGYAQAHGEQKIQTSAKSIGAKLRVSAQVIRPVLHGLARNDFTLEGKDEVFRDERGLFDLDSTRVPEAGEYCRVFKILPLTQGAYTGFLEAAVAVAPELFPLPKREPRQRHAEVQPPPDVVQIAGCPGDPLDYHPMTSDPVICAGCEGEFVREIRYTRIENATPYRFEPPPPVDVSSDTSERFAPRALESDEFQRLTALYERAQR